MTSDKDKKFDNKEESRGQVSRPVLSITDGQATSDGAGVKLKRVIGGGRVSYVDPFLLLDEFRSDNPDDYIAGFPPHPHRGMETVTYMVDGRVEHQDSLGNKGVIGPGDAQWMTAGSGIIHSEMPAMENGRMWGLQLWVNLPKKEKMTTPRYQELSAGNTPSVEKDGVIVRVLAGEYEGVSGPIRAIGAASMYIDVTVEKGKTFSHKVSDETLFAYILSGTGSAGKDKKKVTSSQLAVFGKGDFFELSAGNEHEPFRFIAVAGTLLNEQVARGGPFVMNTPKEIEDAWREYRQGTFIKTDPLIEHPK
ncbi:MAG: pirin family protein [Deltaproteobacteria bacterium]|nr:pirin family protein [Deltaproteobacteria bacterium]